MELKIVEKKTGNWKIYFKLEVTEPSGGKSSLEENVQKIACEIMSNRSNWEVADYPWGERGTWIRVKGRWYRCFGGEDVKSGDIVHLKINTFHWLSGTIIHACEQK